MNISANSNPAPTAEAAPAASSVGEQPVRTTTEQSTSGEQADVENQVKKSETTDTTETVQTKNTVDAMFGSQPRYVYVQQPETVYVRGGADPNPGMTACAMCGCLFSWIPIVGCITFIVNCDAPPGTQRRSFATMALIIACIVILFNIFFWPFH
jgi:hypothetical protein